jgi:hypothetical protein
MFSDPLAVTYDGSAKSLPRVSSNDKRAIYRTADGQFEVETSSLPVQRDGRVGVSVTLYRRLPDPSPSDVFDDYREIRNGVTLSYTFDTTRAECSVDIPLLRTAVLALCDSTFQSRLIGGEI